jgi:hypothetical protein
MAVVGSGGTGKLTSPAVVSPAGIISEIRAKQNFKW